MRFAGLIVAAGCAAMGVIAACSSEVIITAEHASNASAGSGASGSSGQGATTGVGGASSSGTSVTSTATVGSGGSGSGMCCGPNPIKTVTAETDIAQYVTVTLAPVPSGTSLKIADGPFFLTDVSALANSAVSLATVAGNDCSVPQDQHTNVAFINSVSGVIQAHAIRLAVTSGHALCVDTFNANAINTATFIGFKPY